MWPCGALASLLSFIYLPGWHDSPHVCMRVFQGAEGLPSSLRQLVMAIQTLPGLAVLHSCWLGDTFSLWLFCTCGLAVTRAVQRLGSGLPRLRGVVKDADPTKPGTCKAAPAPSTGASSTDFTAGQMEAQTYPEGLP